MIQIRDYPITDTKDINFTYTNNIFLIEPVYNDDEPHIFPLDLSKRLPFINSDDDELLYARIIGPDWNIGWKEYLENYHHVDNETIYNEISDLFHYINQFYYRSVLVSIISGISIGFDKLPSMFGSWGRTKRLNISDFHLKYKSITSKDSEAIWWIEHINGFDPYINRLFFCYLKSKKLFTNEFFEEYITQCYNFICISTEFINNRLNENLKKEDLAKYLMIDETDEINISRIGHIRNTFCGHPSSQKWWEFCKRQN